MHLNSHEIQTATVKSCFLPTQSFARCKSLLEFTCTAFGAELLLGERDEGIGVANARPRPLSVAAAAAGKSAGGPALPSLPI